MDSNYKTVKQALEARLAEYDTGRKDIRDMFTILTQKRATTGLESYTGHNTYHRRLDALTAYVSQNAQARDVAMDLAETFVQFAKLEQQKKHVQVKRKLAKQSLESYLSSPVQDISTPYAHQAIRENTSKQFMEVNAQEQHSYLAKAQRLAHAHKRLKEGMYTKAVTRAKENNKYEQEQLTNIPSAQENVVPFTTLDDKITSTTFDTDFAQPVVFTEKGVPRAPKNVVWSKDETYCWNVLEKQYQSGALLMREHIGFSHKKAWNPRFEQKKGKHQYIPMFSEECIVRNPESLSLHQKLRICSTGRLNGYTIAQKSRNSIKKEVINSLDAPAALLAIGAYKIANFITLPFQTTKKEKTEELDNIDYARAEPFLQRLVTPARIAAAATIAIGVNVLQPMYKSFARPRSSVEENIAQTPKTQAVIPTQDTIFPASAKLVPSLNLLPTTSYFQTVPTSVDFSTFSFFKDDAKKSNANFMINQQILDSQFDTQMQPKPFNTFSLKNHQE